MMATPEIDADLARAVRSTTTLRTGFYVVVLLIALGGQVSGAMEALDMQWYVALPAVGALELGGMVVLANADVRRRLGEHATLSRLLSAAIAGGAVAFNWLAHTNHLEGGFYGGMSLLGYLVWLMNTENKRRDRLRAKRQLPPTPPAYEVFGHWLRHPWITRRARSLAKADPALGLYESLEAARAAVRTERRLAAISKVLHRKIRASVDRTTADIAVAVYDLDRVAQGLADAADYPGLTRLIAVDLDPVRLTAEKLAGSSASEKAPAQPADDLVAIVDATAPTLAETVEMAVERRLSEIPSPQANAPIRPGKLGRISERPSRRLVAKKGPNITVVVEPPRASRPAGEAPKKSAPRTSTGRPSAADKVLRAARALPAGSLADIARKAGVTPETAKKHLSAVNGSPGAN